MNPFEWVCTKVVEGKKLSDLQMIYHEGDDWGPINSIDSLLKTPELFWDLREKPMTLAGVELPKPEITPLLFGTKYFTPLLSGYEETTEEYTWDNDQMDKRSLERGFVYLNESDAKKVSEAILKLIEEGLKS